MDSNLATQPSGIHAMKIYCPQIKAIAKYSIFQLLAQPTSSNHFRTREENSQKARKRPNSKPTINNSETESYGNPNSPKSKPYSITRTPDPHIKSPESNKKSTAN